MKSIAAVVAGWLLVPAVASFTALQPAAAQSAASQLSPSATWAAHAANDYQVFPNVTYLTASNFDAKLDVYQRRGATMPQPTVVYFHGGFWAAGAKEGSLMSLIPWMEVGLEVVDVRLRVGPVAAGAGGVGSLLVPVPFLAAAGQALHLRLGRVLVPR